VLKSVWQESPYDETLTGLEDLDFAKKALARGCKIAYVADAPVVHVHEESWSITRNRYRREAIAYRHIVDGAEMSLLRALGLALTNIAGDYKEVIKMNRFAGNFVSIPLFRSAQFIGAWEGFHTPDHVSARLLDRFYYPPDPRTRETSLEPGRRIDYSDDSTTSGRQHQ
jgi:hypothetical protein